MNHQSHFDGRHLSTQGDGRRERRGRGLGRGSQRMGQRLPNGPFRDHTNGGGTSMGRDHNLRFDGGNHHQEHNVYSAANEYLEARDIGAVSKSLIRIARMDTRGSRNDPRLRDFLARLYGMLHAPEIDISPRDLADIANALGKLQICDPIVHELMKIVADTARYRMDKFTPYDMAGMVWGFATLGIRNESLMSVIAAEVVNKIDGFDQRQLSNTAWAFAKCGLWNEQLVNAIGQECLQKINAFTAQSLSHTSWALAQWGTQMNDLTSAIASEVQKKITDFQPAPLAMTSWSFASLLVKDLTLMTSISKEASAKITNFKTHDLAHLAWAFGNLRIQDSVLFDKMAQEIQRSIKRTLPAELANIAWAFSKINFPHETLMSSIASEAVLQIRNFKPSEVAMLTWAFAVAGIQNKHLMTEIGTQVAKKMNDFSPPQLSHIAWAFGALSLRHCDFLKALSSHVVLHISAFKPGPLSNIAWAFAMVTFRDVNLLSHVAPEIARDVSELRPLALARCGWAYRVLAVHNPDLMCAISAEAVKKLEEFPTKALVKLVDAVYLSPTALDYDKLETKLSAKISKVAEFLLQWKAGQLLHERDAETYRSTMTNFGLVECGMVGTPLLLSQLGIGPPSLQFMQQCRKRLFFKQSQDVQNRHCFDDGCRREVIALQYDVRARDQSTHEWIVRYVGEPPSAQESCATPAAQRASANLLLAVELPGRYGCNEIAFAVLVEFTARVLSMGVDCTNADDCATVEGSVQILYSTVPSTDRKSVV